MQLFRRWRNRLLQRFRRDERGAAAVEFALILPPLLLLYIGSIEASSLFTVDRRVEVIAATGADLVARWNAGTGAFAKANLQDYFSAAQGIMTPYPTTGLTQVVSFLTVTSAGVAKVTWSCGYNGGTARTANSTYTLKTNMKALITSNATASGYAILAEVVYPYKPVLGMVFTSSINLKNEALFLPRFQTAIASPTGGCPT